MEREKVEELQQRLNGITGRYEVRFAGKARATRDLGELDALIGELRALIAEGERSANGDVALREILQNANQSLEMYEAERGQIEEAKRGGEGVAQGAQLATWANHVFDEYRRHFAGQNRATRDLGRLEEMIAELEALRDDMADLVRRTGHDSTKSDLEVVKSNLTMYEAELENIEQARDQGNRDERVSVLANAANEQFRVYRDQFAGKSRSTRRPALIERMAKNLESILAQMLALNASGSRNATNTKNIQIVRDNLAMYQSELAEIRKAREAMTLEDLAGSLGGAANDVMQKYGEHFAGQNRATRDEKLLSAMCDELYELALQMREVADAAPALEMNKKNLSIVLDNLSMYQQEYQRIAEAKGS